MTDWSTAADDYVAQMSRQPGARPPATFGEIWSANWRAAGLDTVGGVGMPYREATSDLETAIAAAAGMSLDDYARSQKIDLRLALNPGERTALLGALADTLPEDRRKTIEPLKDVRARAADKAQQIEREAADVAGATYGLSGHALAFASGVARQVIEPTNIAAMAVPFGGGGAGVISLIGREAAAGAVAQAIVEPAIERGRAELGLEAGFGRAAVNIGEAAIGSGALAGLFKGAGATLRYLRRGQRPAAARAADPAAPDFEPEFTGYWSAEDNAAFPRAETVQTDRPLSFVDLPSGDRGGFDIAGAAEARVIRDRRAPEPAPPPVDRDGFITPEDAAAFDRGDRVVTETPRALGDVPDRGSPANFDIAGAAQARVTRDRRAPEAAPAPVERDGFITPDDATAFDRGDTIVSEVPRGLGDVPDSGAWRGFDVLSARDYEAAMRLTERDAVTAQATAALPDKSAAAQVDAEQRLASVDRAMEQGAPLEAPPAQRAMAAERPRPPVRRRIVRKGNLSAFEFLASKGGLAPHGDLQYLLDGNPFVPGFGRLIRKTGMSLDHARETLVEAGYLLDTGLRDGAVPTTFERDVLDLVADEARGNRRYAEFAGEHAPEKPETRADRRELRDRELDELLQDVDISPSDVDDALRNRIHQIVEKGDTLDVLVAYEQAVMEDAAKLERKNRGRQERVADIPGWDVPDEPGGASPGGGGDARGGSGGRSAGEPAGAQSGAAPREPGEADRAAADAGQSRQLGDPALAREAERALSEMTAAGEQGLLPGVGKVTDKEKAQARAAKPMRGGDAPPPEGGLFDDGARAQSDLVDAARQADVEITLQNPDGTFRKVSAREALAEAEEQARAAAELGDCLGSMPAKPENNT